MSVIRLTPDDMRKLITATGNAGPHRFQTLHQCADAWEFDRLCARGAEAVAAQTERWYAAAKRALMRVCREVASGEGDALRLAEKYFYAELSGKETA
jgi:hypothetical protein